MKINKKYLHIAIIVLGTIFLSLCAFHTSLWFDESYSVAIAKHGFADIWKITGNDVHPALYYWALHILYMIFGNNVLVFRLFSVLATVIVGILGYTHIRKDFGERTRNVFLVLNILFACNDSIFTRSKNVFMVIFDYNLNCDLCL